MKDCKVCGTKFNANFETHICGSCQDPIYRAPLTSLCSLIDKDGWTLEVTSEYGGAPMQEGTVAYKCVLRCGATARGRFSATHITPLEAIREAYMQAVERWGHV